MIFSSIGLIKQITNTYRNHFSRSYENCSIQFIKPVAFLVQWPTHGEGIGGVPTLIYPLDNCFETEIITTEHACIFKHCSFKTTLVSHVLIKALVEIKENCMAGGAGGSLLSSRKATSANRKGQTISVT